MSGIPTVTVTAEAGGWSAKCNKCRDLEMWHPMRQPVDRAAREHPGKCKGVKR